MPHPDPKHFSSDLIRYFAASLLALAVDTGTLSACLRILHLGLACSATLGFIAGAMVTYLLSILWVFKARTLKNAPMLEFLAFVGIGVAGLGITQMVLWIGVTRLGLLAEIVKLAAATITFTFNFIARKSLLFATSRYVPATTGTSA